MKPYYQDDYVTIYHGDCREILPELPRVDLVLTDPPYNVGKDYGTYKDDLPDDEYAEFMRDVVSLSQSVADNQFWVAPRYKLPLWLGLLIGAHLVVVRRGAAGPYRGGWSDQFEIALAIGKPCRADSDLWDNIRLKGEGYFFREEAYGHPGYTPYPILARAAALLSDKSLVDPFAGTGTSLVAGKTLNRKCIGIEIEERYCEIAANRCRQMVMELNV